MGISAKVIAHSRGPNGAEIATLQVRLPRFILAQLGTHRSISKNTRSSRAVPTEKLIAEAETDPVIPLHWGRNRKGMAATEELSVVGQVESEWVWLRARDEAVTSAKRLAKIGAHKQIVNRLLEPFLWVDVVATATDWSNFFALRCDKHAQPEMQAVAVAMARALRDSEPAELSWPKWHLPYVSPEELDRLGEARNGGTWNDTLAEESRCLSYSVARCARVSYRTFDGSSPDPEADIELRNTLEVAGHWSPFEHQALCGLASFKPVRSGNFLGWDQYRQWLPKSVHTSFDYSSLDAFGDRGFIV